jgi:DNA-binding transcriptional LysR family regulator
MNYKTHAAAMNITSRQLKAFLLTARYQSFSRAADQLFITQSGMSMLVRELEAQLGFRLFERTTRKVSLTEFGSRFLPIAQRSVVELESAAANIGRAASAAGELLTLGAAPFVAAYILPAALAAYARRDRQLHVREIDAEPAQLGELVRIGELDAALTAMRHELQGLRCKLLMRFTLVLAASPQVAPGLPGEVRWSEIARRPLVGFPARHPIRSLVDEQLAHAGRRTAPDVECNYLETQLAMVEAGAGVAVVPSFVSAACAKRGIPTHRLVSPETSGELNWLVSASRKLPARTDAFTAFLGEYIAGLAHAAPRAQPA